MAQNLFDSRDEMRGSWGANWYNAGDGDDNKGFILNLGCTRRVNGIRIKNSRTNRSNRGTKTFKLSGSMDTSGPWAEIVEHDMPDPRSNSNIQEEIVSFGETQVKFLQWRTDDCWGGGCALQYLFVMTGILY